MVLRVYPPAVPGDFYSNECQNFLFIFRSNLYNIYSALGEMGPIWFIFCE